MIHKRQFLSRFSILRDKWSSNYFNFILGSHVTSQALFKSVFTMLVSGVKFLQWSFSIIAQLFRTLHEYPDRKKNDKSTGHRSKGIPVLSENAKSLESRAKESIRCG